jgi:hypothetical protein
MAKSAADLYVLPEPWAQSLTSFQKLMLVKVPVHLPKTGLFSQRIITCMALRGPHHVPA